MFVTLEKLAQEESVRASAERTHALERFYKIEAEYKAAIALKLNPGNNDPRELKLREKFLCELYLQAETEVSRTCRASSLARSRKRKYAQRLEKLKERIKHVSNT